MRYIAVFIAGIFLPLILGGAPEQACTIPDSGSIPIPDGYTAHLENPQMAVDSTCKIFAATRPNSGTGGLVWSWRPGEQPIKVFEPDPRKMYALGEFTRDNRGRLLYVTVPDPDPGSGGDNDSIDWYLVPGWTP